MPTVLLVHGEAGRRVALTEGLVELGWEVVATDTAWVALGELGRRKPAALLLDLDLPDWEGLWLCCTLAKGEAPFPGPIVGLTCRDRTGLVAARFGADDVISGPATAKEISARLAALGAPLPARVDAGWRRRAKETRLRA